MDLSSNRSQDEDRVMQRQLYRPGQNQPAPQAGAPARSVARKTSAANGDKSSGGQRILMMILLGGVGYYLLYGTPSQRRKVFIGLGVAGWLLLLGTISYCLSLPDLEALNRERMALFQDKNLSPEERREKFEELREKEKNLTPAQRKQMREMSRKEMTKKMNSNMFNFFKLSPEEQIAQVKREAEEWAKRREEMRKFWANKGGQQGNRGGGQNGNKGGPGGGGPPGGWGGGGNANADRPEGLGQRLDSRSPEARAGAAYKGALMQKMGIGFGGRGGPGGGGPGGGGR
jgi:hypothetical protein